MELAGWMTGGCLAGWLELILRRILVLCFLVHLAGVLLWLGQWVLIVDERLDRRLAGWWEWFGLIVVLFLFLLAWLLMVRMVLWWAVSELSVLGWIWLAAS